MFSITYEDLQRITEAKEITSARPKRVTSAHARRV